MGVAKESDKTGIEQPPQQGRLTKGPVTEQSPVRSQKLCCHSRAKGAAAMAQLSVIYVNLLFKCNLATIVLAKEIQITHHSATLHHVVKLQNDLFLPGQISI